MYLLSTLCSQSFSPLLLPPAPLFFVCAFCVLVRSSWRVWLSRCCYSVELIGTCLWKVELKSWCWHLLILSAPFVVTIVPPWLLCRGFGHLLLFVYNFKWFREGGSLFDDFVMQGNFARRCIVLCSSSCDPGLPALGSVILLLSWRLAVMAEEVLGHFCWRYLVKHPATSAPHLKRIFIRVVILCSTPDYCPPLLEVVEIAGTPDDYEVIIVEYIVWLY